MWQVPRQNYCHDACQTSKRSNEYKPISRWFEVLRYVLLFMNTIPWRHNEHDGVSNHQPHDCLLNLWFRRRSKKTSKLRVIGLCGGNSPVTGEFPAQMASNAENDSIWWRHHERHRGCTYIIKYHTTYRFFLWGKQLTHSMMTSSNGNIFRVTGLLCGEFTDEFPSQRPMTQSSDVFFDLCLNERLSRQWRGWWFET